MKEVVIKSSRYLQGVFFFPFSSLYLFVYPTYLLNPLNYSCFVSLTCVAELNGKVRITREDGKETTDGTADERVGTEAQKNGRKVVKAHSTNSLQMERRSIPLS